MTRTIRTLALVVGLLSTSHAAAADSAAARLIMFSSPTCGPCQQMKPLLRQMASAGYQVQTVDATRHPALAQRHGVEVWPTFVVLIGDQVYARAQGARSLRDLETMVQTATTRAAGHAAQRTRQDTQLNISTPTPAPRVDTLQPQPGRMVDLEQAGMEPLRQSTDNAALLEATVRISVEDETGHSRGTGTIVDARSGEALILTCGHIFRESQGRGQITVTLFTAGPQGAAQQTETTGALIDYDLDRDLGLISIRPPVSVKAAQIAATDASQPGMPVATVGCNRGADPTVIRTRLTAVNRYEGHPNIEAAGAPIEGRSGGGIFNAAGQLIGVCFAADPAGDEGLYVALGSIHEKLDEQRLTMVYRRQADESRVAASGSATSNPWPDPLLPVANAAPAAGRPFAVRGQEPATAPLEVQTAQVMPQHAPLSAPSAPLATATPSNESPDAGAVHSYAETTPAARTPLVERTSPSVQQAATPSSSPRLSAMEQATLEELRRRGTDSEVICIIRPRSPEGKSEVINLSKVSPAFVEALVGGQGAPAMAP